MPTPDINPMKSFIDRHEQSSLEESKDSLLKDPQKFRDYYKKEPKKMSSPSSLPPFLQGHSEKNRQKDAPSSKVSKKRQSSKKFLHHSLIPSSSHAINSTRFASRKQEKKEAVLKKENESSQKREERPVNLTPPVTASLIDMKAISQSSQVSSLKEIDALFEKMVGTMSVMHAEGIQETSFVLNSSLFNSSPFFGTEIVIQEFSTAPKVFNVKIIGSQEALALVQQGMSDLLAAFKGDQYAFKVNRLDTQLSSTYKPLFHRKEKVSDQSQDERSNSER